MTQGRMTEFTVRDREREIQFTGVLLGHASSQSPQKPRWSEVSVYRTQAGKYVAAGIGQTSIEGETPHYWAHVSESAEGVVASLHLVDGDDVRYLTKVARRALTAAAQVDRDVHNAFMVEKIA